ISRWRYNLIPAESKFKTPCSNVKDKYMMKAQVTSGDNLECDMPITIPLPTTDVREEDFDINSPLGEQVVDILMENEDVAGLPRHLVKQLFSHLVKITRSIKRMSDEPLGDDTKPRSYDVTSSNPLFDFNDNFTICHDNPLFNEEFEDISSLDTPKSTPLIEYVETS
nr:NAC domain-containing protein [Tanacetum cinerariifolium]